MDTQGNAEASSSRLSEDVDDVMDVDEEEFEADEMNEGGWDEDRQEYGGRLIHAVSADSKGSDDSGSRDDYVDEAVSGDEGDVHGQSQAAGATAEEEQAPEEGFEYVRTLAVGILTDQSTRRRSQEDYGHCESKSELLGRPAGTSR